jgi:prefoldin alpha subunit
MIAMVPLTESVYVPGTLMEKEELLVEIGTRFYVEKTPKTSYLKPSQRNLSELALGNEETSSDFMMKDNKSTTDG